MNLKKIRRVRKDFSFGRGHRRRNMTWYEARYDEYNLQFFLVIF